MIVRIVWIAALLGLALVTAMAQIDRSSRFEPTLAALVPEPFRGFSQARLTQQALATGQVALAVPLARELVRVRPVPAENLTLLSQALLQAGDTQNGLAVLEVAGTRGWREPVSQLAVAQAALMSANPDAASLRIVALMATAAVDRSIVDQMTVELLSSPEGRDAMARRLTENGYWQQGWVRTAASLLDAPVYIDTIARAQAINAPLDCAELERGVQVLRDRGLAEDVTAIWPGNCPVS